MHGLDGTMDPAERDFDLDKLSGICKTCGKECDGETEVIMQKVSLLTTDWGDYCPHCYQIDAEPFADMLHCMAKRGPLDEEVAPELTASLNASLPIYGLTLAEFNLRVEEYKRLLPF